MAAKPRFNKVIELLEREQPVFCSGLVWNGNLDDLAFIADSAYDMVIVEMEHQGFSFDDLRVSLQFLLNRRKVAQQGNLQADHSDGADTSQHSGAQPMGHQTGLGYRRVWVGIAALEHSG